MQPDPRGFPLEHLSVSSLQLYLKCPEKWRRRYLLHERESSTGAMLVGTAGWAAEAVHYHRTIDGRPLEEADVLDVYSDEFDLQAELAAARSGVDWQGEKPGTWKDQGAGAVRAYHEQVAPQVLPVSVERQFRLRFPGVDWTFVGYIDLEALRVAELEHGAPVPIGRVPGSRPGDVKIAGKRWTKAVGPKPGKGQPDTRPRVPIDDVHADVQVTSYLAARRAEGDPASGFDFHVATRTQSPVAEVIPTSRTDAQLDQLLRDVWAIAAEIAWRTELDHWHGAPFGAWWCSPRSCGFYSSCRYRGAFAQVPAVEPIDAAEVIAA